LSFTVNFLVPMYTVTFSLGTDLIVILVLLPTNMSCATTTTVELSLDTMKVVSPLTSPITARTWWLPALRPVIFISTVVLSAVTFW